MKRYPGILTWLVFVLQIFNEFASAQAVKLPSDTGAVWNYICSDASNPPPIYFYPSYTITGDTLIGAQTYSLVNYGISYLLREDSIGRVYIRYLDPSLYFCTDTNEILACDFSLSLNDQIYIHSCYGDSILCQVVLVDSILTNHGYRKQINLTEFTGTLTCGTGNGPFKWVDGIGDLNDLFYNLNFFQQGSVCLQYYDFLSLDSAGQNIHFLTNEVKNNYSMMKDVFIDSQFNLHCKSSMKQIKIYDVFGRLLWSYSPENYEHEVNLQVDNFKTFGIKIIIVETEFTNYKLTSIN